MLHTMEEVLGISKLGVDDSAVPPGLIWAARGLSSSGADRRANRKQRLKTAGSAEAVIKEEKTTQREDASSPLITASPPSAWSNPAS
jgi:hypothetical protein